MNKKIPQHVAIIMDGNGRWAEHRGLFRSEGHRAGVEVVKNMVRACLEKKIPVLSIWAFGRDNWARPQSEVEFIMQLFLQALQSELQTLQEQSVRIMFTGDREPLSVPLKNAMDVAEVSTSHNSRLILNVVFNYGGKWDIVESAKKLAKDAVQGLIDPDDIDESMFANRLSTLGLPDPDLFIRTSGEQRISNFFLWQLAYTEFYFSSLCWPDFTIEEFDKALACFSGRERRYGKTSQQLNELAHV